MSCFSIQSTEKYRLKYMLPLFKERFFKILTDVFSLNKDVVNLKMNNLYRDAIRFSNPGGQAVMRWA